MFVSNLKPEVVELAKKIEEKIKPYHERVDETAFFNQQKVLAAFRKHQVSDFHLNPSTGYGYDDEGRDTLERVYAEVFGAESALVRSQIISGTHAITLSLFGVLRPGDELIYITGKPYDTLQSIVDGGEKDTGSLKDFGIHYRHIDLIGDREIDWEGVRKAINEKTKMVAIQRSKGYATRPSFTIEQIREMCEKVREIKQDVIIFVDNCYGEFVEPYEPLEAGADLIAGSLIKNPGGTLAVSGGYIVGRGELVELCAEILTAPHLGGRLGSTFGLTRQLLHGFFLAPHVVGEALYGALLTSAVFERLGYPVSPRFDEQRTDVVQAIRFGNKEELLAFCRGIQSAAPIDAHFLPVPSEMPGYDDEVVMAGGTFIQGSSIELSADGPMREPYIGYLQGGMSRQHVQIGIAYALQALAEENQQIKKIIEEE